jgi:hypothetical protein
MTARIADDGTAWWLEWGLLLAAAADAVPPRDPDDDDEEEDDKDDEDGDEEPPVIREPDEQQCLDFLARRPPRNSFPKCNPFWCATCRHAASTSACERVAERVGPWRDFKRRID